MGRSGDKAMDKRVRMIAEITISDYQAAVDILTQQPNTSRTTSRVFSPGTSS